MSIKCPYCTQTRPTRSLLQYHVDSVHREADTQDNRRRAVAGARTVEDVVAELPTNEAPANPVCTCGQPLVQVDPEDAPDWWTHAQGAIKQVCLDPEPATEVIKAQHRDDVNERMAETGRKLDKARQELADLKARSTATLRRLEALDAGIADPVAVRRATLLQAWDQLIDAGNIAGAQTVMGMVDRNDLGDWS